MSTKSNQPQATGKTFFHIEENGDNITVKVEGKAGDLVNLFANVLDENADLRKVIEMAIMSVDMKNGKDVDPMAALMALMAAGANRDDE